MTTSRLILAAVRSTLLGALLVGIATMAIAQGTKPPVGPPLTTKGTMTSSRKALLKGIKFLPAARARFDRNTVVYGDKKS